jgi:hypothetical protein
VFAGILIGTFIVGVFIWEFVRMWWVQTAWRRRWRNPRDDD